MKCVLAKRNAGLTCGGYKVRSWDGRSTPDGDHGHLAGCRRRGQDARRVRRGRDIPATGTTPEGAPACVRALRPGAPRGTLNFVNTWGLRFKTKPPWVRILLGWPRGLLTWGP